MQNFNTNILLPEDSRSRLGLRKGNLSQKIDNFSLFFSKAAIYEDGKFKPFQGNKIRQNFIPYPFKGFEDFMENKKELGRMLEERETWLYGEEDYVMEGRMIVGMGDESVYENSLHLDHLHGIPVIPSSAVKGTIRNLILIECFDALGIGMEKAEKKAFKDPLFTRIFGNIIEGEESDAAQRGKVLFMDAYPIYKPRIVAEIINVHFPAYYQGKSKLRSLDEEKPSLVSFVALSGKSEHDIKQTLRFSYTLAEEDNEIDEKTRAKIKPQLINNLKEEPLSLDKVLNYWMKQALTSQGIGAKTAVGYGFFHILQK